MMYLKGKQSHMLWFGLHLFQEESLPDRSLTFFRRKTLRTLKEHYSYEDTGKNIPFKIYPHGRKWFDAAFT
jgi:hypothetical protein